MCLLAVTSDLVQPGNGIAVALNRDQVLPIFVLHITGC